MDPARTIERVDLALAELEHGWIAARDGLPTLELAPARLHAALAALRDRAGFETLTFVTAVDWLGREPRFDLVHQLHSLAHNERLRLHTPLADGQPAESCTDLWPGAGFMERECFDLFGIEFTHHPDLRRLLMPEGYGHHPLRKDFPHQGIEPDRLYREWDRQRRKAWHPEDEVAR